MYFTVINVIVVTAMLLLVMHTLFANVFAKPVTAVDPLEIERQQCVKQAMAELDEMDRVMGVLPAKVKTSRTPAEILLADTSFSRALAPPMSAKQTVMDASRRKLLQPTGGIGSDGQPWGSAMNLAMAKIRARHEAGVYESNDWAVNMAYLQERNEDLKQSLEKKRKTIEKTHPCSKCGDKPQWSPGEEYPDHICDGYQMASAWEGIKLGAIHK